MSELKGFAGTLRQVGGSKVITVPDWLVKSEGLQDSKEYRFFVELP